MNKIKAAIVAAAVVAGLAVSTAPAQASNCTKGGATYVCEYGVTDHALPGGEKEQFLVGTDLAVWTRWTSGGKWSGWFSLGGTAWSKVAIRERTDHGPDAVIIYVKGSNTRAWGRERIAPGQEWGPWDCVGCASS
ncbi:hypothetical protein [Streptomyces sp. ISL-11]|uniref:hypothetical protein n=1 Tax=Streptomyces sp. ISL-11 TaxID=2819174 RepID=UPI001BEA87D8|nr:hypothetical protein [Streptomyces sp. ISL-11]MBT2387386.1 hypothetical protein [Streptomyces sp. ISL-11]